jgi:hypothetical protein
MRVEEQEIGRMADDNMAIAACVLMHVGSMDEISWCAL